MNEFCAQIARVLGVSLAVNGCEPYRFVYGKLSHLVFVPHNTIRVSHSHTQLEEMTETSSKKDAWAATKIGTLPKIDYTTIHSSCMIRKTGNFPSVNHLGVV